MDTCFPLQNRNKLSVIPNTIPEVKVLRYPNLSQLLLKSSSSRQYFLSLPVAVQMELHSLGEYIHTAEELHRYEALTKVRKRQIENSEYYRF